MSIDREAQRIVRRFGWLSVIDALLDDGARGPHEYGGRSNFWGDGTGWLEYDRKQIAVGGIGPLRSKTSTKVRWSDIRAYGKTLSPDLLARLDNLRHRSREHQANYRTFFATGEAIGCGPAPRVGPLTRRQALYVQQYETWETEVRDPWYAEKDRIESEREALLDLAFPLSCDNEPADLLELLAALS